MATPSASSYNADAIEVLSGLDPVRKRPGMYTDTSRPNHLAQEVIDNSVDEFIMGHGKVIEISRKKESVLIRDYGRGIPLGKVVRPTGVGVHARAFTHRVEAREDFDGVGVIRASAGSGHGVSS